MTLGIACAVAGLLVVWAGKKLTSNSIKQSTSENSRLGTIQDVQRVRGWSLGDRSYWFKLTVIADGIREPVVVETGGSMWKPKPGTMVHVEYNADEPSKSVIAESNASDGRIVSTTGYVTVAAGIVITCASLL